MRDAGPSSGPFRPWLTRPFGGYLILLAASEFAILLGVQFGAAFLSPAQREERVTLWLVFGGIFAGVMGLGAVVAALLRHVATLSRQIECLREQSANKPVDAPHGSEAPRSEF